MTENTVHTYAVTGMTCDHCARAVRQEVGALPGVTAVHVEVATGDVTVTSDRPLARDEVAGAVDEAGYQLAG
ncbi:heavy-metal-associated domain-containing protein [Nocardioides taihuensis]|uniref:Heavy-metal-associated domain-containing protein n=1 Tax=Nocardioides taihuensis TaxID=1835606 RepID=A0ABW0BKQ6_9ACTN